MKNLAIIPARSGSKGLINKNIRELSGKPLIAYTIEAAIESNRFSEIMVSTDSEEYAKIAIQFGAKVPFLRSEELSTDTTSSWDVVLDVIKTYSVLGKKYDTATLLQPTSPLRTAGDIKAGFNLFHEKEANTVVSVCEMNHSPLWSNTLPEDLSMINFLKPELLSGVRQRLKKYYRLNGAIYIVKVEFLLKNSNIYSERSYALIMSKERSLDIDDEKDFIIAEALLKLND